MVGLGNYDIDGLVQERRNSSVLVMELRLFSLTLALHGFIWCIGTRTVELDMTDGYGVEFYQTIRSTVKCLAEIYNEFTSRIL